MWRNQTLCALWVGMQNGAGTVGNSSTAPQKIQNKNTMWSSNSAPWSVPNRIESRVLKRCVHARVPNSIVHTSQNVEATQVLVHR